MKNKLILILFCALATLNPALGQDATVAEIKVALLPFTVEENSQAEDPSLDLAAEWEENTYLSFVSIYDIKKEIKDLGLGENPVLKPQHLKALQKALGVSLVITGKVFVVEKERFVAAQIQSAESAEVVPVLVKNGLGEDFEKLIDKFLDKAQEKLQTHTAKLLPGKSWADVERPLPRSKRAAKKDPRLKELEKSEFYKEIKAAIEKGKTYLEKQRQDDGSWGEVYRKYSDVNGTDVLCVLALMKAGVPNTDPEIVKTMKRIEKTNRIPSFTYEAMILLMALEAYGLKTKKGTPPKKVSLYKAKGAGGEAETKFDFKVAVWMEEIVAAMTKGASFFDVQWKIPEPKSEEEIGKRLKELKKDAQRRLPKDRRAKRIAQKKLDKIYGKKPGSKRVKYKLTEKNEFQICRWRYEIDKPIKARHDWDNSNLQYIYLGLMAARRAGIDIESNDVWRKIWYGSLLHWLEVQQVDGPKVKVLAKSRDDRKNKDIDPASIYADPKDRVTYKPTGQVARARGWAYWDARPIDQIKGEIYKSGNGPPAAGASMTPAGLSSVLLIRSILYNQHDYLAYFEDATEQSIMDGFAWIELNWRKYVGNMEGINWAHYSAYGVERVGIFAQTETIGPYFWYRELAKELLKTQQPDGHFKGYVSTSTKGATKAPNLWNTAWALLVLSRSSTADHTVPPPKYSYHVTQE